jgi:hypothetical protein
LLGVHLATLAELHDTVCVCLGCRTVKPMAECLGYKGSGGGMMPTFSFVDLSYYFDFVHLGYALHEYSRGA